MPEIAEVRLNTDLILKKYLNHEKLLEVDIVSGKYKNKKPLNYTKFVADLPAKIISINNRGKFIWIELDNQWIIAIGFGMTGRFFIKDGLNNTRIVMKSSSGIPIYYVDPRNFGNWNFWNGKTELNKKLADLGHDVISEPNLSKKVIVQAFRKYNKWDISKAIMSQKILAGPGNYIRNESLYDTKIYPYAKVSDLTDINLYKLYKNIVKIASNAYTEQKKNFVSGIPYENFKNKMNVYNKLLDPLGNKITRSPDLRTTWWVKNIQIIGKK